MRLERMTGWQDPRFEALWELYEASFPAYENRTLPDQKRAMEDERYHVDLIYEGDQWQGFVMYWQAPGYLYVEHFAVFPCGRGKGYGSKVLTEKKKKEQPVLLEINIGGEASKTGAAADLLWPMLEAAEDCPNLLVQGLMTVPPQG